ncbi:RagB/SusD family nutrient uptake outer membrane protein [Chitinophaga sedimenti]|uniref:RagB/SusD family nutrient uptake outer membrane protein n=1 Tax=Chitinophaga sedimenti TaxID=2033606 RepID=UPI00200453D0|nr:RagB/SusD family nutrient uptake outer membrane protein [Chitinophaga sedimenti]MCK7554829.1 RagB/SusD family nutrient uptake outer membrane protein [Chitinophaga sedimenti]
MKQFIIKITFFSLLMAGLSSCKKWLDLQPEDQFTQEQVYTNPTRIAQALNGLYATLSDNNMYGGRMSMTTLELLAQRYFINAGATGERPQVQQYAYDKTDAQNAFEAIWRNSYNAVSDINEFIGSLETYSVSVLDAPTLALYKGEAIGLRSMIQLDMLRLFGPVYRTDSTLPAVPYYNKVATALSPLLPANQAMDSILRDLRMASALLAADPVITQGPMHTLLYDGRDFARLRNYRMNYYAVQLLLARAELYRGNTTNALLIAETALQGTTRWFPWVEGSRTMISVDPDRVYYTEVLMGLYHAKLAENHKAWFAADVTDASIYRPEQNVLDATFEGYGNDVRYHDSWVLSGLKVIRPFLNTRRQALIRHGTSICLCFAIPNCITSQPSASPTRQRRLPT